MAKKHKKKNKEKKQKKQQGQKKQSEAQFKPRLKSKSKSEVKSKSRSKSKDRNLIIREMTLEDLSAVYALGERLFTADWPTLYRTWDEYEIVGLFASDGDFCLVADQKGKIVGFVLGTLIDKRNSAWSYGYILWLGVAPEVRGHGLGEHLVNRITELFIANGARMMLVDTSVENQPAIRLFRRLGFGSETQHIYFFKNLTHHPEYLRRRGDRRLGQQKAPPMVSNISSSGSVAIKPDIYVE